MPILGLDLYGGQNDGALFQEINAITGKKRLIFGYSDLGDAMSVEPNPKGGFYAEIASTMGNYDLRYDKTGQLVSLSFLVFNCLFEMAKNNPKLADTDIINSAGPISRKHSADIYVNAQPSAKSLFLRSGKRQYTLPMPLVEDGTHTRKLDLGNHPEAVCLFVSIKPQSLLLHTNIEPDIELDIEFNRWTSAIPDFLATPNLANARMVLDQIIC